MKRKPVQPPTSDSLFSIRDLRKKLRLSPARIYDLVARGEFPKQIKIGRSALWVESEIRAWMNAKKAERAAERRTA